MSKTTTSAVDLPTVSTKAVNAVSKTTKEIGEKYGKARSAVGRASGYEQHIAVFGESGSGKTTLLSAFYGKQQSMRFIQESGYELLANDVTQGNQLLALYNQIRDNGILQTRMNATRYEFSIRPATPYASKNAIRLVWHDYPGEWLTERKDGLEDARKNETFEQLVKADVAYFLVDAQKLKTDGVGYLKRLFSNFKDQLVRMHDNFDAQKKLPFRYFPRLWFICLSKADLLPDMDVKKFKDKLSAASEEISNVERVLNTFVNSRHEVDFQSGHLLLSSLKMNPDTLKIENWEETIGVDALVPLSFFTPIFRAYRWAKVKNFGIVALKKTFDVGGKVFSALGPAAASLALIVASSLSCIPLIGGVIGGLAATPIAIAAALFSASGLVLQAFGGGMARPEDKSKRKISGLQLMIKQFQLRIIEIRTKGVCEIKDIEEYLSQKN